MNLGVCFLINFLILSHINKKVLTMIVYSGWSNKIFLQYINKAFTCLLFIIISYL